MTAEAIDMKIRMIDSLVGILNFPILTSVEYHISDLSSQYSHLKCAASAVSLLSLLPRKQRMFRAHLCEMKILR